MKAMCKMQLLVRILALVPMDPCILNLPKSQKRKVDKHTFLNYKGF